MDTRPVEPVHAIPSKPIRTNAHLDEAVAILDRLLDRGELASDERDYLTVLSEFVHRYEAAHVEIPTVRGIAVLRYLMEQNGLTQADLIPEFGAKSTVSEVLSGKRGLSRAHIRRLSERFGLPADVFLD